MKFDINKHIEYRKQRYSAVNITNPKLLGLAAVEINPTELCNRTCSFCPRHDPAIYPNRNLNMDIKTAQKICKQLLLADYNGDINITGFGEPLLNKNIIEICKVFSKHFHTELITNGDTILNNKVNVDDLKCLDLLIIDCYDGDKQYKQFESYLQDHEINYLLRPHYDTGEPELVNEYGFNNRGGSLYIADTLAQPCYLTAYKAFIDWNGDVRICCNDWFRLTDSFGNVNETNFDNIWMSQDFTMLRKQLINGSRQAKSCAQCDVNGTLVGKESAELWI
jgi:radical SAM protein with 4Fe4S-binding SPASM domain